MGGCCIGPKAMPLRSAGWCLFVSALFATQTVLGQVAPNNQPGITIQLPVFGVAISPQGLLEHKQFAPAGGELFFQRVRAARVALDQNIQQASPLRKISLARLQSAIRKHLDQSEEFPDEITRLAGLQRIEYVFAWPEKNDIVIAGTAEGWVDDASGRAVGMNTGRPVMLLEDLVTALRAFGPDRPREVWVGCSINPTAEGLDRLAKFRRQIPPIVPVLSPQQEYAFGMEMVQGLEGALGDANVVVFGIPGRTNMARVMVEADYRMKLIAMGREPPPIRMPVFMENLNGAPRDSFQRWWFTPDYECVEVTDDRLAFHMAGQGVQLGTEGYEMNGQGRLVQTQTKPVRAARMYADSFTKNYGQIANASPVFAQLRNAIDALIVAGYLKQEDLVEKTGLDMELFLDPDAINVETQTAMVSARSLANAQWKSGTLIAPSGGVSIMASEALRKENLLPANNEELQKRLNAAIQNAAGESWWWD